MKEVRTKSYESEHDIDVAGEAARIQSSGNVNMQMNIDVNVRKDEENRIDVWENGKW